MDHKIIDELCQGTDHAEALKGMDKLPCDKRLEKLRTLQRGISQRALDEPGRDADNEAWFDTLLGMMIRENE